MRIRLLIDVETDEIPALMEAVEHQAGLFLSSSNLGEHPIFTELPGRLMGAQEIH